MVCTLPPTPPPPPSLPYCSAERRVSVIATRIDDGPGATAELHDARPPPALRRDAADGAHGCPIETRCRLQAIL